MSGGIALMSLTVLDHGGDLTRDSNLHSHWQLLQNIPLSKVEL